MVDIFPTFLYSAMIGMVVLALIDVVQKVESKQNTFLKALLALLLLHLFGELFIYSGAFVYAPGLAGIQFPFRVLLGAALFGYAHATMSPDKTIDNRLKAIALSGPVVVLIVMLPFIFHISPSEKLALATPETRDPELWQIAVLTCLSTTAIFIIYTLLFLGLALKLHNRHRQQLMERFSSIQQRSVDWFKPVLFLWGAVWLMYAVEFSLKALGLPLGVFSEALLVLEVVALALFINKALNQKQLSNADKGVPQTSKAERSRLLDESQMAVIATKLQSCMLKDKLYLEEDLSLNRLSSAITESENHISETLSQFLHTNFFQFVNGYRVEAAKQLLKDKSKLVTTVAFDVGFNSKSTFNSAFKKAVGHSPTAYRKQLG